MLITAIALILLSLPLMFVALRGRVVQRGAFCSKCRFDLVGIDQQIKGACCPECGKGLADGRAVRGCLRRKRWGVLTCSLLLLISGLTLSGIILTNNAARVMTVLPDRAVMLLHDLGVETAFTEIATNRLTRNKPWSENAWTEMIEEALDHQEDVLVLWDPRHGEVLMHALMTGRLSEDQLERYFKQATTSRIEFPEQARYGADSLSAKLHVTSSGRISSLNGTNGLVTDGVGSVWNRMMFMSIEIIEPALHIDLYSAGLTGFHIPTAAGGGSGEIGVPIDLDQLDWDSIQPGDVLAVRIMYETSIVRLSDNHVHYSETFTLEHQLQILPQDVHFSQLSDDQSIVDQFRDQEVLRISPLRLYPLGKDLNLGDRLRICQFTLISEDLPITIAGELILIHKDGEESLGKLVLEKTSGSAIRPRTWINDTLPDVKLVDELLRQGNVTIEIRPDVAVAEERSVTDKVLGVTLRFEDVVVTSTELTAATMSTLPNKDQRTARPVLREDQNSEMQTEEQSSP